MIDTNADTVTWADNGRIAHCCLLLPSQTYLSKCQVTVPVQKIMTMVDPPPDDESQKSIW